jgi:cyanate permease
MIIMQLAGGAGTPAAAAASSPAAVPPSHKLAWPDGAAAGIAGLIWGLFNLGLLIFFSFEPAHLAGGGRSFAEAASLASLALWISIGSLPLGGYLVERARCTEMAVLVATAALGVAVFLLRYDPNAALLCSFIGVAIGFPAGALIALPGSESFMPPIMPS